MVMTSQIASVYFPFKNFSFFKQMSGTFQGHSVNTQEIMKAVALHFITTPKMSALFDERHIEKADP